ncbi:MAG TPA: TetR/AcrR family transcriptional regulator [Acidimicrobiales bacterium]|nr:TetR/AcrR family transcriptional regulator [Acidimicrobiales bacterium]
MSSKTTALGALEPALQSTGKADVGGRPIGAGIAGVGRPYRGLTPDERRAARRQRLLDAGLTSFGTVGYGATTIERLCSDAGVTPRHFYDEFPSREALLAAVYDDAIRFTREATRAALAATQDPGSRTRAAIEGFVHAMCDDPRRARVLCIEGVRISAEFERHRRQVIQTFATLMEARARRHAVSDGVTQPRFRPMVLLGVVHELVIEWVLSADPPPIEQLIDELAEIWIAACQPV